ncbi:nucleoside-triphosphate diphosphatase [Streptococcus oriscaviae]|uniref:dITP/XTP pyrophosphatase n=1 Tax=Streptococcus oriscaviae TaxID=2781599 RepID=A0ABX7YN72_9STRE|nr:nucleoside-triphosphate diphosphatase [Streptococcus oriscaviae]QUE55107.1 nucleoside-triphosphate diphosphatase [Streptococcus oriscaviae]
MTDKIYEYKDAQNWFIGKCADWSCLTHFGRVQDDEELRVSFHRLMELMKEKELEVHIVTLSSKASFFQFLLDIIQQEMGRQLSLIQHQGALLITEGEQLILAELPSEGVPLESFFGRENQKRPIGDSILIATKNEGKTKEFRNFFEKLGYQVENLNDYPELPDVAETGLTFEENARLKAETIAQLTGKMVLADDSGLKVDKLGGLPGVWSARFSGPDATDASNNAKLLHELAMVFEKKDRSAQFHCTLVMAAPDRESLVVEADWAGYIGTSPRGEHGFGYDPLFLVGETGRTSAELSLEEKNKISHRAQALEKLLEAFPVWQAQAKQS